MGLFGALVRTAVNVVTLPVAVAQDVLTMGGELSDNGEPHILTALRRLKDEANEDEED